ncbi:MAG: PIN domain-containing protein [Chitinophagaceae bacterium]|nr:PIN domain-containing protein [Chitinophagaceae bacterium]
MKNLFLDTDVVIDALADRFPFSANAALLFEYAEQGKARLYLSALSYSNIYYIIRKSNSHKQLLNMLEDLQSITETLDVTKAVITAAIKSDFGDFEDAIQYFTAFSQRKMNAIVTRNVKDFKRSELAVLTPEEAVHFIEQ